jgi:hypothetical protein
MSRTKKLCAVVVDTLGREVMVRRPCVLGEDGWPAHPGEGGALAATPKEVTPQLAASKLSLLPSNTMHTNRGL